MPSGITTVAGTTPDKYRDTTAATFTSGRGGLVIVIQLLNVVLRSVSDENGFYSDMKCPGQPYRSTHPLKCEFHALAYEVVY